MINLGDIKTLIAIITAAVIAVLYFAPMRHVEANREQIAMISATAELAVWEDRKGELEDDCLDRKQGVWLCSDVEKEKWRRYLRHIQLLEKKLGLPITEDELP